VFARFAIAAALLALAPVPAASAQECLTADPAQAREIARMLAQSGGCPIQCRGCGCKGGPGYREKGPNGQCVSWRELNSICGPAPHSNCIRECRPAVGSCSKPNAPTLNRSAPR
jgi:hypothetical protein